MSGLMVAASRLRLLAAICTAALAGAYASSCMAADDDFYKGKTLTMAVASKPGGGTDTSARLVARYWTNHIPGRPNIVVQNKNLELAAANDFQYIVRPDGLTIGAFAGSGTIGPVSRKSANAKYNPLDWELLGAIDRGPPILLLRKAAQGQLLDRSRPFVAMGSVSTDRLQDAMALFGAEYLGWNIKFVLGYPGSNELYLSFERGELDMFASGTAEIVKRFVNSGVAVPLAAANRRSDFPDVPSFEELLGNKKPTGVEWQAFYAFASADLVDKYFAAPPKVPSAIVKTLRDSFMATLKDEAFLAQAQKVLADGVIPVPVEELREHIKEAIDIPPEVATQVLALRKKYNLPISADAQPK